MSCTSPALPNFAEKMSSQEGKKSSRRMSCGSSGSSFRDLDTEFLTTQAKIWIENVLDQSYDEEETVADLLADGEILYKISKLISKLMENKFGAKIDSPVSEANHFGKQSGKYLPYSYIDAFLKICKKMGLTSVDLFSPPDAVEKRDVRRVCLCIRALSKKARSNDLDVPDFDLVTDFLSMSPDMVDVMQKYLKQDMYSMLSRTSNLDPETKEGSGKDNQPFFACSPEVSTEDPDEAESKLKSAVFEISDSFWGENSVTTVDSHSMSPRSPQFAIHGSSSESSTVGGLSIRGSLTDVNAPLRLENDTDQQDIECFRIKETFLTDALNIYLEKSGHLTVNNSTKISEPPTPLSNEDNFFNEYPTNIVNDKKDPVNREMENIAPVALSYDTNPAIVSDINNVNYYNVNELGIEFLAMDYASKGKLNAVDIDHITVPKEGVLHMLNEDVPKTGGTDVDCSKVEPLHTINVPSMVFKVNNNSHYLSDTVDGGYAHSSSVQVSDDFVERTTNDMEVDFKYEPKAWRVDVGLTDTLKLGRLDVSHENRLKGESVDSYHTNVPQALDIYTDKTKVLHVNNVVGCYMHEPHLDIDLHEAKPDYGNTSQTVIVDMGTANVLNADSMDVDSMPSATESWLVTADSSLIADFISKNAYEECRHSTFMTVCKGTEQGELNNTNVYTKVLQKEVFDGDPTDAPELESLDIGPKYTQKADSLCQDNRFFPEVVSVNLDQCVNKENLNIDCGVIPKGDSVDMVDTIVSVSKIDSVDIAYKVEVKEGHVATSGKGLESNNVADESAKLPKSEAVVDSAANVKAGDINCAIDTEEDSVVTAGNSFVVYNIDNCQSVLKEDIIDAERAVTVKTVDINCAFVTVEDTVVNPGGNGLDTDIVDHISMNTLKSEILVVDSVVNKQTEDINFGYVSTKACTLSAHKGLEAEIVNDYKPVLKSEIVDIDGARYTRTGKINCENVTEEHNVNAANDLQADIDNDCRRSVEVDSAGDIKMKNNCLVVPKEECIFYSGDGIKSDNVDGGSNKVLKPAIVDVGSPANMQMGKINCAVMIEEICVANARNVDNSEKVLELETVDICSVLNIETRETNCEDMTEEDRIVNDDNGFSADNFDYDSKNLLKPDNVGVDYALNMKKGHTNFLDATELKSFVNAVNGLEEDVTNHLKKVLKSDTVFESGVNMRTRGINHGVVVEEVSIANERNVLEAINIEYGSVNVMNSETTDIDSAVDMLTVDIGCSVVIAEDHTACVANGFKALQVVDDTSNVLQLETVSFDSAVNMETGDMNCPLATELDSIANPGNKLEVDNINEDGRNVLKLDIDSSRNVKTKDIDGGVLANDYNVVDSGNALEANDNANGSINMLKLETLGINNTVCIKTGYIKCPVMGEVESAAHVRNMLISEKINNDSTNSLKPETFGVENAAYMKTGDINCSLVTDVENVLCVDNELQTDEVKNDTKNVLKSDDFCVGIPSNAKRWDINSKVVIEEDSVNDRNVIEPNNVDHDLKKALEPDIAAGNLKMGNNIEAVEPNRSEASNMDIFKSEFYKGDHIDTVYCPIRKFKPSETAEENSLIASDSGNQLQPSADCEHCNDLKSQQNEIETRSPEKNESEEKHRRKSHRKRLWISVLAGGIAVGVTMGAIRLWNRKQREFEIKEGDTLSDISKRAGKSSWKELVFMNSEIKNPDLIYPGQRIKLK